MDRQNARPAFLYLASWFLLAGAVGLEEGAQVEGLVEGDHLVIRRKRLRLADLLGRCKPENRPDSIDWGPPVGRETI